MSTSMSTQLIEISGQDFLFVECPDEETGMKIHTVWVNPAGRGEFVCAETDYGKCKAKAADFVKRRVAL